MYCSVPVVLLFLIRWRKWRWANIRVLYQIRAFHQKKKKRKYKF